MTNNCTRYLIDTNTLITPYKLYYPFDLAINFWRQMKEEINNGNLLILDLVKKELIKGDDELSEWIKDINSSLIVSRKNPDILKKYGEILGYIQTCGYYKDDAVKNWADKDIADAWIIATASVYDFTVITQEVSNGNLNTKNKARNAKIPDICKEFDVKCENLFYMMRQLSFTI